MQNFSSLGQNMSDLHQKYLFDNGPIKEIISLVNFLKVQKISSLRSLIFDSNDNLAKKAIFSIMQ